MTEVFVINLSKMSFLSGKMTAQRKYRWYQVPGTSGNIVAPPKAFVHTRFCMMSNSAGGKNMFFLEGKE